jgi:hypothetical protein
VHRTYAAEAMQYDAYATADPSAPLSDVFFHATLRAATAGGLALFSALFAHVHGQFVRGINSAMR